MADQSLKTPGELTQGAVSSVVADNTPPPRTRPRRRAVNVDEETARELTAYHEKIDGYVMGFLKFRSIEILCKKARTMLEDGSRHTDNLLQFQFLRDLRDQLGTIQEKFVPLPVWEDLFEEPIEAFGAVLGKAQETLEGRQGALARDGGDFKTTIDSIGESVNSMIGLASRIASQCEDRCPRELEALGTYLRQVFRKLRERITEEASGSNLPLGAPSFRQETVDRQRDPRRAFTSSEDTNVPGAGAAGRRI